MADRNLVLQLLITAKDDASAAFGKFFKFLNDETNVVAGKVREAFSDLFSGGLDSASDLEAQLDRVAAKGGYTADEISQLKAAAQSMGAQFGVSGVEAAQGMESLAAAGLTAAEAMAALPPVLALAASEQISADSAAQKLIDSLSIMGMGFEDTAKMADVLAKGANITTSSAAQLAEALTQAGGMARAAGMGLEQTVAALDLLHKNGIKGSEAGTALKSILTSLLDPASKASTELNALGISSRDLGTVMAALKEKGGAANAAILAFGTEAGPGLRALLEEGQGALNEMTLQLENADGAAQDAADQMGGNLKSALASLGSAWDSLKAAMLEPLLEPIAKAANELTAAFQAALADGSIKGVQTLLKEFGTGIAESIKTAIASFDFKGATQSINAFAQDAKGSFAAVQGSATAAAGAIQVAFNLITAPIKAVVSSTFQTIGNLFELLSSVEAKAAQVGLGTVQRADELMAKANAAKDTARDVMDAAKQDVDDLTEGATKSRDAFDGVTEAMRKAREEAEKAQPPNLGDAKTLEPIRKSLEDYRNLLNLYQADQREAITAALEAQAGFSQGKVSVDDYRKAQEELNRTTFAVIQAERDVFAATQDVIAGRNQEKVAVQTVSEVLKQKALDTEKQLKTEGEVLEAVNKLNASLGLNAQAELALAKAKGDYQAVAEAEVKVIRAEIEALKGKEAEQKIELKSLEEKARRIGELMSRQNILTAAEAAELALLKEQNPALGALLVAKQKDIETSEKQIEVKERERRQAEIMAGPIGALTRLYADQATEHQRTADASERYQDAQTREAEGALKLAQIKGDAKEIDQAQTALNDQKITQAQFLADLRAVEATDAENALEATKLQLAADGELSVADQMEIKSMEDAAASKRALATASQQTVDQLGKEADATKKSSEEHQKATSSADGLSAKLGQITQSARANMGALSEQAKVYFDMMTGVSAGQYGIISGFERASEASSAFNAAMSDGEKEMVKFRSEITAANYAIKSADISLSRSTGSLGVYLDSLAKASAQTTKLFYEQKLAAKELELSITGMAEKGSLTMSSLQIATRRAGNEFSLLDEEDLSGLTSALDKANQKLREMQQEAQDAQARLAELNAEIAAEKGDTDTADRLKLELDQQQQLAEVEAQLAQARAQNNRDLIALYEEQKQRLQELYSLKERNLEKDIRAREEQERAAKTQTQTTNSSSGGSGGSGSSAGGKTYNLNLNAGGKTLTTTTASDPGAWLDELERARRGAA